MENRKTILIVDDCAAYLDGMQSVLAEWGYGVVCCQWRKDALDKLHNGLKPDLILSDFNSPGMDFPTFAKAARAILPHVPIVLASGNLPCCQLAPTALRLGVCAMLDKPFKLADLKRQVQFAVSRAPQRMTA